MVIGSTFWSSQAIGPFAAGAPGEGNGGAINSSSAATITNSRFNGNLALGRVSNVGHMRPDKLSDGEKTISRRCQIMSSNGTIVPLRTWIMGRGDLAHQNVTLPFAALLFGHQAHLAQKAATRHKPGQSKS